MARLVSKLVVCLVTAQVWTSVALAETIRVPKEQLRCVQTHIDAYLAPKTSPHIIVFPACPIVNFDEAFLSVEDKMLENAENSMFPPSRNGDGSPTAIASFSRQQLKCLSKLDIADGEDPVVIDLLTICHGR